MNLNGTIKKTQALSGRLVKSSGGGGSVQEIYWVQFGVGTATNAEVNEAVAANKLPICYWDSTDAYGRPRRTLYFLIRNTPTESFFSGVDYINNTIIVRRLYADAWDTQTIRYEGKLTWDTTPRFGSANPVTSGGIYQALQDVTVSDERIAEAVDDWLSVQAPSIGTMSYAAKQALLACFRHVAWIDDQGQSYYNALESELLPDAVVESINAVFTQGSAVIYDTDSLDTLRQYLVVTATFSDSTTETVSDYTLSGTLSVGTSTITVSYGSKTDSFSVTVTKFWTFEWDYSMGKLESQTDWNSEVGGSAASAITTTGERFTAPETGTHYIQVFPIQGNPLKTMPDGQGTVQITFVGNIGTSTASSNFRMSTAKDTNQRMQILISNGKFRIYNGNTPGSCQAIADFANGVVYTVKMVLKQTISDIYINDVLVGNGIQSSLVIAGASNYLMAQNLGSGHYIDLKSYKIRVGEA